MNRYKVLSGVLVIAVLANLLLLGTVLGNEYPAASGTSLSAGEAEADKARKALIPDVGADAITDAMADAVTGMQQVAENEFLTLYFQPETTEVAVKDKRTQTLWRTNPEDREQDALAAGPNKTKLNSQLAIAYYNEAGLVKEYDNFNDSIRSGQFETEIKDGAVKVRYALGDMSQGIDVIPKRISVMRMKEKILNKLQDESVRRDVLKRFKLIEAEQVYERRDNAIQEVHLKRLMNVFAETGYTMEELQEDNAANGFAADQTEEKPLFHVSVEYRLDGDNLLVTVPGNEVASPQSYVLQSLRLLEYFGAANQSKQGYMFVPDGSGALIYLNNGKLKADPYQSSLYGMDNSRYRKELRQFDESSRLPVFGMKQDDDAFIAILEQGDALGTIEADVSGRRHAYNTVYSSYQLAAKDELTLTGNATTQTTPIFQAERYQGDIRIRYGFLSGDQADYSGMAAYYRNYLVEQHQLQRLPDAGSIPFFLELVGGITKQTSFLGIPYQSLEPLTTFEQARLILEELQAGGVEQVKLRYTGWFNQGVSHKPPSSVTIDKQLGGAGGFSELADYTEARGIGLYPDVAFLNIYKNTFTFSPSKEAARYINRSPAKLYPYSRATYEWDKKASPYYVLSPNALPSYVERFLNSFSKYRTEGISLRDMGYEINADYRDSLVLDRQEAKDIIAGQMAVIHEQVKDVMVIGGNAAVLPYAASILYAPLTSSRFAIADESVPFYEMVIHGYIDYAGEPLNVMEDQNVRKNMLKLLETGASIHYQWYYAPSHAVKDTAFNHMYASHYGDWIGEAKQLYQELNPILKELRSQTIKRHEKIQEGVFETRYDGGSSFIVNYNKAAVTVDGKRIEAENYIRKGEA